MSYPESMSVNDFADRAFADRAEFASLWEDLSDEEMTVRPGPQEDWSVKDLIVHITWWEQSAISRVRAMQQGKAPVTYDNFDTVNAQIWESHRDDPLDDVLKAFEVSANDLEDLLQTLSDEEFNRDNGEYRTYYSLLGGNTIGHYSDHWDDLEGYVNSLE